MDRQRIAERKYRPLKKELQQTLGRITLATRSDAVPGQKDIEEFGRLIEAMVSYPGFGDEAYPELVAASRQLALHWTERDLAGIKHSLARIAALRARCHAVRGPGQDSE